MGKIDGDQVVHFDNSWMSLIINKEDSYVNLDIISEQINMFVFKELGEHIKNLTILEAPENIF